jgi:hypothetical protein
MSFVSESYRTEKYAIEKNECLERAMGDTCFDKRCIAQRHTYYAVNEVQGEFGEVVWTARTCHEAKEWAKDKYGI